MWTGAPLATLFAPSDGHRYAFVSTMTHESWHDAHAAAQALRCCEAQGHLLVVSADSERDFVRSHAVPHGATTAWIGIVDEANDGVWKDGKEPRSTSTSTSPWCGVLGWLVCCLTGRPDLTTDFRAREEVEVSSPLPSFLAP
jgi:Lectin C-type domain